MLISDANPRLNEVRMLRRRDVQLRFENGEPVGGFITIREGWLHGEAHTPKTGQREVPMSPEVARVVAPYVKGHRDGRVALNEHGKQWSQYGLDQAFGRLARRTGLAEWSVYTAPLRDYVMASRGHSGSRRAAHGGACAFVDDAAVCAFPQGGPGGCGAEDCGEGEKLTEHVELANEYAHHS